MNISVDKFTLTHKLDLYCDLTWARNLIQSTFPIGSITGMFIITLISDTKGRKIALIICLSLSILGIFGIFLI